MTTSALLDTSVLIAHESGRPVDVDALPEHSYVSVITIGELTAGVHAASDTATRARRLETLRSLGGVEPLPVDDAAARAWGALRVGLRDIGRSVKVNDLWIAAIAQANQLPVVTQDHDFDALAALGLSIVRA